VIGAPFFDSISLQVPGTTRPIRVTAKGASAGKRYVTGVTIDGALIEGIVIHHSQISGGVEIVFEMTDDATT